MQTKPAPVRAKPEPDPDNQPLQLDLKPEHRARYEEVRARRRSAGQERDP